MESKPYTGDSHIYDSFVEIKDHSFRSVVKFYESNYFQIKQLPLEEYTELLFEYLNALFELSHYRKYIKNCHELIELSIEFNVYTYQGEDILENVLLRKAACHYHLYQTDQAEKVIIELLKINPENKTARLLYERCERRNNKSRVHASRSLAIILLLSSAIVISVELLVMRPFYGDFIASIEWTRNVLFVMGLITLVLGEIYNKGIIWFKLHNLLSQIKSYKNQKSSENIL